MTAIKKRKRKKKTECTEEHNIAGHAKKIEKCYTRIRLQAAMHLACIHLLYYYIVVMQRSTARKKVFASVFFFILKERVLKCQARNI